jgi:hypothetical protein
MIVIFYLKKSFFPLAGRRANNTIIFQLTANGLKLYQKVYLQHLQSDP